MLFPCVFLCFMPAGLLIPGVTHDGAGEMGSESGSAEDAGTTPIALVYFPTFFLWMFDMTGMENDPRPFSRVMLPRCGLTLLCAGFIFCAGDMQARITVQDGNWDNPEEEEEEAAKLLNCAKRLERSGHSAVTMAGALFGLAGYFRCQNSAASALDDAVLPTEGDMIVELEVVAPPKDQIDDERSHTSDTEESSSTFLAIPPDRLDLC